MHANDACEAAKSQVDVIAEGGEHGGGGGGKKDGCGGVFCTAL